MRTICRVDFFEKLKRRAAEINKSKAGIAAGLKANTISSYLAKRSIPRADIAFKIAVALGVPLDWLLDDRQGWPPPKSSTDEGGLQLAPDDDLMDEVARRYRIQAVGFHNDLSRAEQIDWLAVARQLVEQKPGVPFPKDLAKIIRL